MRQPAVGADRPGQNLSLRPRDQGDPRLRRLGGSKASLDPEGAPERRGVIRSSNPRTRHGHLPPPTRRHLEDPALHGLRIPRPYLTLRQRTIEVSTERSCSIARRLSLTL